MIPRFDGAILSQEWKEATWDKFVTGAPRPRTPSEQQYSDRKLRSRKVAAITGTSPGAIGTAVGQQHLRQILGILGALVVGGEAYISFKPDLIDEFGEIADETTRAFLNQYLDGFLAVATTLNAGDEQDGERRRAV